jgi:hypothetical protein
MMRLSFVESAIVSGSFGWPLEWRSVRDRPVPTHGYNPVTLEQNWYKVKKEREDCAFFQRKELK